MCQTIVARAKEKQVGTYVLSLVVDVEAVEDVDVDVVTRGG